MLAVIAALVGALIGGLLSVLSSWIAQRVQSRSQLLALEIQRRQQLYSDFVEEAANCYSDALHSSEPDSVALSKLYGELGRMRLVSSDAVIEEAHRILHIILDAYRDSNQSWIEIRDFLARDSVDLYSAFAEACRMELARLQPLQVTQPKPPGRRIALPKSAPLLDPVRA